MDDLKDKEPGDDDKDKALIKLLNDDKDGDELAIILWEVDRDGKAARGRRTANS